MGVPGWLSRGLRATYDDACIMVMFNEAPYSDCVVALRRGIEHGCPVSGALWSVLFDPIVRRPVASLPPQGYSLACFADDLAAALCNALIGLRALIPVLLETGAAEGLILHAGKPKLLSFSSVSDFALRRALADVPVASSFEVVREGVYLGVPIGTGALCKEFDAAILKFLGNNKGADAKHGISSRVWRAPCLRVLTESGPRDWSTMQRLLVCDEFHTFQNLIQIRAKETTHCVVRSIRDDVLGMQRGPG